MVLCLWHASIETEQNLLVLRTTWPLRMLCTLRKDGTLRAARLLQARQQSGREGGEAAPARAGIGGWSKKGKKAAHTPGTRQHRTSKQTKRNTQHDGSWNKKAPPRVFQKTKEKEREGSAAHRVQATTAFFWSLTSRMLVCLCCLFPFGCFVCVHSCFFCAWLLCCLSARQRQTWTNEPPLVGLHHGLHGTPTTCFNTPASTHMCCIA